MLWVWQHDKEDNVEMYEQIDKKINEKNRLGKAQNL
jgi:hypothetical protein